MKHLGKGHALFAAVILCVVPVVAQEAGPAPGSGDSTARPTEMGLRFTPGMAQAVGQTLARNVLTDRYELPEEKAPEAAEAISRRIMQACRSLDTEESQRRAEQMIADIFRAVADQQARGEQAPPGMPPGVGQAFARGIIPALPAIREAVRGVGQDLRPMLPVKQQLKLAADLVAFGAGLDYFESTMQRWSNGDVKPFEDPFRSPEREIEKDESGRSAALRQAVKLTQDLIDQGPARPWQQYVEEAKKFYQLDESQAAAADSLLREALEEVRGITQDVTWRARLYANRLWHHMSWRLLGGRPTPLRDFWEQDFEVIQVPVQAIGDRLKRRLDEIPTQAQRKAAQERVNAALAEQGFDIEPSSEEHDHAASQESNDAGHADDGVARD